MADKRATKRERREDAKRRRMEELRRRQRRARMRKIITWSVIAIVVGGGIAAGVVLSGSGDKKKDEELARLATAAGCAAIKTFPNDGATHVDPPQTVNYKSNPPTSGNHYGSTAQTGIHSTPVQNEQAVHNLEHGHIVIQYKAELDGQILDALEEAARNDPPWIMIAPSTTIPSQVAFSAWDHSQLCNSPTTLEAVKAVAEGFVEKFKNQGPEKNFPGTPTGV